MRLEHAQKMKTLASILDSGMMTENAVFHINEDWKIYVYYLEKELNQSNLDTTT